MARIGLRNGRVAQQLYDRAHARRPDQVLHLRAGRRPDSPAIKKTLDWMWSTQWDTGVQAFKYVSEPIEHGWHDPPTPDLTC